MASSPVMERYVSQWGKPARSARFQRQLASVEVHKWESDTTGEGVAIYATVRSDSASAAAPGEHLFEFFMGANPECDEAVSALGALSLYPGEERIALGHGHTVPGGGPLWPGTEMDTFLLVSPRAGFLDAVELDGAEHVSFLQAIPLYQEEALYKTVHGVAALMAMWENTGVRFWDPTRASSLSGEEA